MFRLQKQLQKETTTPAFRDYLGRAEKESGALLQDTPSDKLDKEKVFFPNLDGFRFLSFFLVFLHHAFAAVVSSFDEGGRIFTTIKIGIFQSAPLGVSFFFVLSGFLITYLILTEQNQYGKLDIKAFYLRRVLRIWPLHYALIGIVFLLLPLLFQIKLPNLFYYVFFLSNFDVISNASGGTGLTDIMWSVAVEEQFYLVWPLLFFILKRNHQIYLFAGLIILSSVFRWVNQHNDLVQHFHTLSVISELAIGGLAAYCTINFSRFRGIFTDLPKWSIVLAYMAIVPMLLFSRLLYAEEIIGRIVLGVALAFIILEQNFSKASFYKMKNFLIMSSLGKYTYGLYLLHPVIIFLAYKVADAYQISKSAKLSGSGLAIVSFFLSVSVCYVSYHYYEAPFLKLKRHFSHVRTT